MKPNGHPKKRPSPRQVKWLEAIRILKAAHQYDPSYEEIAAAMGVKSPNSVHQMLNRMEKQGLIRRKPHSRRQIEVLVA